MTGRQSHEGFQGSVLRGLQQFVKEQHAEARTWPELVERVRAASGWQGAAESQRKTLRMLEQGTTKELKVKVIEALDSFALSLGIDLGRFIAGRPVFEELAAAREISLFVGAVRDESRTVPDYTSSWSDLRATQHLMDVAAVGGAGRLSQDWHLVDVPLLSDGQWLLPHTAGMEWRDVIERSSGSLIAIGQSYKNLAAELMLSTMMSVPPFERGTSLPDPSFRFVWSAEACRARNSSFSTRLGQEARYATKEGHTFGVIVDGELRRTTACLDDDRETVIEATAVVVAQRRRNRGLWVVCAGASGPATLGAAKFLTELPVVVPELTPDGDGDVIWVALNCSYDRESARTGEVTIHQLPGSEPDGAFRIRSAPTLE